MPPRGFFYRRKLRANIETPNQTTLDPENVAHPLFSQQLSAEVAHSLMDLDHGLTVRTRRELQRHDMRIDHRPLACPIAADALACVDVAAVQPVCPYDILVHGGEGQLDVAAIEMVIEAPEQFQFTRQ